MSDARKRKLSFKARPEQKEAEISPPNKKRKALDHHSCRNANNNNADVNFVRYIFATQQKPIDLQHLKTLAENTAKKAWAQLAKSPHCNTKEKCEEELDLYTKLHSKRKHKTHCSKFAELERTRQDGRKKTHHQILINIFLATTNEECDLPAIRDNLTKAFKSTTINTVLRNMRDEQKGNAQRRSQRVKHQRISSSHEQVEQAPSPPPHHAPAAVSAIVLAHAAVPAIVVESLDNPIPLREMKQPLSPHLNLAHPAPTLAAIPYGTLLSIAGPAPSPEPQLQPASPLRSNGIFKRSDGFNAFLSHPSRPSTPPPLAFDVVDSFNLPSVDYGMSFQDLSAINDGYKIR